MEPFQCEQCECNGHAQECQYDSRIASDKESLDITGRYRGGGICINCTVSILGNIFESLSIMWTVLFL